MASTTFIDNQTVIYAAWLNDVNNAIYNGIFVTDTITIPNIVVTGTATGAGYTALVNNILSAPGPIGSITPNTGAFTTLALTNALSAASGGTGLASPGTTGNVLTSNGTGWTSSAPLSVGVGQTWQNLTGSRAGSTTYTNSTGKPIMVCVTAAGTPAGVILIVDGVTVIQSVMGGATSGNWSASVIVPNGQTYSATIYGSLASWVELR